VSFQQGPGLADDLRTGVAEHPLGGRVPGRDDALERGPDDGIIGRLRDRRQALGGLERTPLLGAGDRGRANDHAVRVADR
jgi:hypothetical protein